MVARARGARCTRGPERATRARRRQPRPRTVRSVVDLRLAIESTNSLQLIISPQLRCRLRWHARFIRFTCIYHHEILVSTLKYTSPRPLSTLMMRASHPAGATTGSVRTGRTKHSVIRGDRQQSQCDTLSCTRTSRVAHRVPPRFAISAHKFGEHADVMHSPFLSADEHTISCTKRSTWRSGGDAYFVTPMTPWSTVRSHARM